MVGTINQSELCWLALTNQIHTHVVGKIWCSDVVMWWHGDAVTHWCSDAVVEGKSNDWLVWWQGARQMTDWFGGRGQGKWLTNMVMRWCGGAVMWWCGGRGQGKWLTGLVAGVKANDWLTWWHSDAVTQWCSDTVMCWHSDAVMQW